MKEIEQLKGENKSNEKEELQGKEKTELQEYKNDLNINKEYELQFKIIVIGDSSVGKSSLILNAKENNFYQNYTPIIGLEFTFYNLKYDEKNIKLEIWDTCGQEYFRSLITNFYRGSSLAILVYSIDCKESFENLESWLNEIKAKSNPNVKIILIGNKCDLEDKREVKKEEGEKFSNEHKLNFFMETSAKTGFNAKKMFNEAGKLLYEEYKNLINKGQQSNSSHYSSNSLNSLNLAKDEENEIRRKKCFC